MSSCLRVFFVFVLGVLGPGSRVLRFLKAKACPATPCSGCGSSSAPLPASRNAVYPQPVSALAVELIGPKSVLALPSWPIFVEDSALARRSPHVSLSILGKSGKSPNVSSAYIALACDHRIYRNCNPFITAQRHSDCRDWNEPWRPLKIAQPIPGLPNL